MRLPVSAPTRRPKPDAEWYSTSVLDLFPRLNRKTFAAVLAQQAPPFNPKEKWVKYWWDSTVADADPDGPYAYHYVVLGATPKIAPMVITNGEACSVNIPGSYNYPAYVVQPTKAYVVGPMGRVGLIPADRLSTRIQADKLRDLIQNNLQNGVKLVVGEDRLDASVFRYVFSTAAFAEPRRLWHIGYAEGGNTGYLNVGNVLHHMYANGIGAPGKFLRDNSGTGLIVWRSDTVAEDASQTLPECPIPVRALDSDETLVRRSPFDLGSIHRRLPNVPIIPVESDRVWNLLVRVARAIGLEVGGTS